MTKCQVCKGGFFEKMDCDFCNGSGEANQAAEALLKFHVCQCDKGNRKECPFCLKKCHHVPKQNPHIGLAPLC